MPAGQVVFLSSIDWSAAWQRHQAWAAQFAAAGREVFFVENTGFRSLRLSDAGRVLRRAKAAAVGRPPVPGIQVVSPLTLPPTARTFRALNRGCFVPRLLAKLHRLGLRDGALVIAYLPTRTTLDLLDGLAPSQVVYDCVDNFEGHPQPPADLASTEADLLRRASVVLVTSPFLLAKQSARHPNVHKLHHGVAEDFFRAGGKPPAAYHSFCYFGSLWSAIDYRYPAALAAAGFEVTLLGPAREAPPPLPAGVTLRPAVPAERLPETLAAFDGLLLPYADTPYNQGVVPAKTYECLATGKPVLATPLPGLRGFQYQFYLEGAPEDWVRVAQNLGRTETREKREVRLALAREHTTGAQFQKLLAIINRP